MVDSLASFIEQNRNNIMLCGESCIGKSHFNNHNIKNQNVVHGNMAKTLDDIELSEILRASSKSAKYIVTGKTGQLNRRDRRISAEFARRVCDRALEYCDLKIAKEKRKVIIVLGAPYVVWKKRIKERKKNSTKASKGHLDHISRTTFDQYINNYTKYIKYLITHRMSFILVDNRDNYSILDGQKFFEMLRENSNRDSINT